MPFWWDANRRELLVFKETQYGDLINRAVALRYDDDETLAVDLWKQVLMLDENNELLRLLKHKQFPAVCVQHDDFISDRLDGHRSCKGDNESAMKYLKLGMSRKYYSVAYRRYRNDFLTADRYH